MEGEMYSVSFDYGTVTGVRNPEVAFIDKDGNVVNAALTIFEVQGDDNASRLFELMGNTGVTNVEWAD